MRMLILAGAILLAVVVTPAFSADGTVEGAIPDLIKDPTRGLIRQTEGTFVITPHESISLSAANSWRDNRTRAYGAGEITGFMLFDVSAIPDTDVITAMTLKCYLENDFGNPRDNPIVDVYYSADDGWTRAAANPGDLSLDTLLLNDVTFPAFVSEYDFVLDVTAHDWTTDLADNEICIGLFNDVDYYSFLYVFGAYGDPAGTPCELTIETDPVPVELMSFRVE